MDDACGLFDWQADEREIQDSTSEEDSAMYSTDEPESRLSSSVYDSEEEAEDVHGEAGADLDESQYQQSESEYQYSEYEQSQSASVAASDAPEHADEPRTLADELNSRLGGDEAGQESDPVQQQDEDHEVDPEPQETEEPEEPEEPEEVDIFAAPDGADTTWGANLFDPADDDISDIFAADAPAASASIFDEPSAAPVATQAPTAETAVSAAAAPAAAEPAEKKPPAGGVSVFGDRLGTAPRASLTKTTAIASLVAVGPVPTFLDRPPQRRSHRSQRSLPRRSPPRRSLCWSANLSKRSQWVESPCLVETTCLGTTTRCFPPASPK